MQNKKQYNFLFEQTSIISPSEINILEESTTPSGHPQIVFKARLQESNTVNNNKRIYDNIVCESITNQLSPKANNRSMLMEIDHPMFFSGSSNPESMKRRAAIVEIKNCAAVCRNISFKNGEIIGEISTLSGFRGPDLANLITRDKVNIGFSLRALGGVEPLQDGTLKVTTPIMPITYDVVSNPSHTNARVMTFLPETDMSLFSNNNTIICEGEELSLMESENIQLGNNNIYIRRFIDDIITEKFMNVVSNGIKFNIF